VAEEKLSPSSDADINRYASQIEAEKTHWREDWTAERWQEEWTALHQQNTVLIAGLRKMERDHAQLMDKLRERSVEAENQRRELQDRVKQLEEKLQVIYNSHSWRLIRSYWRFMDGPAGSLLRPVRRLFATIWKGGRNG
jgi:hypothetical protein